MTTTAMTAALAVLMTIGGCGGDASDDAQPEVDDLDADKADAVRPEGTYKLDQVGGTGLTQITLNADRTFERDELLCAALPCGPIQVTGTYRFTKSGTRRFMRFLDQDGNFLDRYEYKLAGSVLRLRRDGVTQWASLSLVQLAEECEPVCGEIGTRSEGWYTCTGDLIAFAQCARCDARCDNIGTRSVGWYTSWGCGADGTDLIKWERCGG